jgi:hypothetical protein
MNNRKNINRDVCCLVGGIFVFPATFFIAGSALNIEAGLPVFYDMAEPLLETLCLNEKLGWNASLLFGFGPIVAIGLTLYCLAKDRRRQQKKITAGFSARG